MRILHINGNYIFSKLHQTMIEHFNHSEVQNDIFVPTYDRARATINWNDNVIVEECFRKWDRILFFYKQRKIFESVQRAYDISNFDLLHAHTLFTDGNCVRALAAKYHLPYVVTVRNTDVNIFFAKLFWLREQGIKIMKDAAAIIFLSPVYQKHVFEEYVPDKYITDFESKSVVIPNGVDDFWLEHIYQEKMADASLQIINKKKLNLLYVGEIDKNKNTGLTLEAINILHSRGYEVHFSAVGKVIDKSEYYRIIKSPFAQYIAAEPKETLINYYRENDIFVMPSHTETFGLVYAEALTQGMPVIYTRGQGFDGQFEEGVIGCSTSDTDAKELAQNIIDVACNYETRVRNCLLLCKKFDWAEIVLRYAHLYKQIIHTEKA